MVRSYAVACCAAALFSVAVARVAPAARYANTTSTIAQSTVLGLDISASTAASPTAVQTSFLISPPGQILPPSVGETTSKYTATNADPRQSLSSLSSSTSSDASSTTLLSNTTTSVNSGTRGPTTALNSTTQLPTTALNSTTKLPTTSQTVTTKRTPTTISYTIELTSTTSSLCTSLAFGEDVTSYSFVPNTTTITLPIWATNATKTPEFTPIPYCCSTSCATPAATLPLSAPVDQSTTTSLTVPIPFFSWSPSTTTVIVTQKNPVTVYTSNSVPDYPSVTVDTKKLTVQATSDSPLPAFPTASPFSTPQATAATTTAVAGNSNGGGGSSGGSSGDSSGQQAAGGGTSPAITVTAGGVPIVLTPSSVVINGQTATVGGGSTAPTTTVVANGQTFTINPSQVIAPGTVINVPTAQGGIFVASPTPTVIGAASISIAGNVVWIGSSSYAFGQGAVETSVVVDGQTISIGSAGLGFAAAKTTIQPAPAESTAVLILGGDVFSAIGSSVAVIGGETFTYGPGIAQTTDVFNGETITIGPSGIIQSATTLGGESHPTGTQIGIAGGLSVTEIGQSIIVIASTTFTIGPGADSTTAVINGETITADSSDIEIGTLTTLSYPLSLATSEVTAGGITLSEIGSSLVVIGGTTFTIGPGAKTTTDVFNSQTISIGPGGVGFKTTTVVPPTATARKKSGVGKVVPTLGLGMSMGLCIALSAGFLG